MTSWAYGVTTVTEDNRQHVLLPRTLASLVRAGFPSPRLFIDNCSLKEALNYETRYNLPITPRTNRPTLTYANWLLALWELHCRDPLATFYAIFQDDFVTGKNLREYLERNPCPKDGYMNLLTFPSNQSRCKGDAKGWFKSNQLGRGAVALVFHRDNLDKLMTAFHLWQKPRAARRPTKSVDGAVVEAMKSVGQTEYVHNPSLVFHTGDKSSMGNRKHPPTESFPGEEIDWLEWYDAK